MGAGAGDVGRGDGMVNREKVIKGLECCTQPSYEECIANCPYGNTRYARMTCTDVLMTDILVLLKEQEPITGETSDGYHTFNELYHHRAVLFSVIVANYPDRAWKSKKHHDGTMYDNMFIVGIDTPDGQATYHYDVDPYWDMFKCRVLDNAPEWDGHTPAQAIERIGKLKAQEQKCRECGEATSKAIQELQAKLKAQEPVKPFLDYDGNDVWRCGNCHRNIFHPSHTDADEDEKNYRRFCFHCGRAVKWG